MKQTHDGRKLRVCAVILAVILTIASIALGIIQIVAGAEAHGLSDAGEVMEIVKGVVILVVGPFLAFVICLLLRGFGTIVRKYENDEDDGEYKDDADYDDGEWEPKPRKNSKFLKMIGIEDAEDGEENE